MKEPTFRIPVVGIQHGHMLSEFQRTWGKKKIVISERVNFIRPAGEMDSTGVALGNSPNKVSPGIHQNNGGLGNFPGYVGVIHPKWGP